MTDTSIDSSVMIDIPSMLDTDSTKHTYMFVFFFTYDF